MVHVLGIDHYLEHVLIIPPVLTTIRPSSRAHVNLAKNAMITVPSKNRILINSISDLSQKRLSLHAASCFLTQVPSN